MRAITAPSLGRAWEAAVRHVLAKGVPITTEDGEQTIETDELILKVENPLAEPVGSGLCQHGAQMLQTYGEHLILGSEAVFDYDYHTRLFRYKAGGPIIETDQLAEVVKILAARPDSRRAIAITWDVKQDGLARVTASVPCLQWIQFLVRDGKLQMKVLFRSNDILSALLPNMIALAALQQFVLVGLQQTRPEITLGSYTHMITVPHIYPVRDAAEIEKWRRA